MTVALILAAKGHDVTTIQPHRTLREAATLLADRGIGSAIVADNAGEVLGIVSERDIVRAIGRHGGAALTDSVSKHMTGRVIGAEPTDSVDHVMETMTASRCRHMPVMDHGRLVGVVSIGDVVKHRLESIEGEHRAMRDYIATA